MNVILVSNRLKTAKTVHVTPALMLAMGIGFLALSFAVSLVFSRLGNGLTPAIDPEQVLQQQQAHNLKAEQYLRDNVSAMAVKLGEMKAQLLRLDALGERVSRLSGVSMPKQTGGGKPGRDGAGGPLVPLSEPLSSVELLREINRMGELIEQRKDELTELESQLMERRIKSVLLPTLVPIDAERIGSAFGRRVDPFAGIGAMHEGIDFVADTGTGVVAAAGGVVATAEFHPQYGNLIEIDHGNDFSSRYAHLSKPDVKVGQIVRRGAPIGASGNTGRSTGPHLHFEVRYRDVAQNPARFLQQGGAMLFSEAGKTGTKVAARNTGGGR